MSQDEIPAKDLPLSVKVDAALKKMAGDRRLKRTLVSLAELVEISRGTVYNHPWIGKRFKRFLVEQEENRTKPKRGANTTHSFDAVKSDAQILAWKRKCDALREENEGLKARVADLRRQLGQGGGGDNVVPWPKGPQS